MIQNRELTIDDYLAMLRRRAKVILIPALLHGVYVSRSRPAIAMLGLASAAIEMWPFLGGPELTHSVWYAWTAPAWLAIYLIATQSARISRAAVAV